MMHEPTERIIARNAAVRVISDWPSKSPPTFTTDQDLTMLGLPGKETDR